MFNFNTRRLTASGIIMGIYIALMFVTQSFAFGQFQVRIATGLYILAAVYPWTVIPLGFANMLSNVLMGGLGAADILGGLAVGLLTAGACAILSSKKASVYLQVLPIAIIPSIVVPIWLTFILDVPYLSLVLSLLVGQTVSAYTLGLLILKIRWTPIPTGKRDRWEL
jgi:uncharacterized membrane protein